MALTKLSALLRRITSKNVGNFYYLNCLRSFKTKNKFQCQKELCQNKEFCNVAVLSGDTDN